jgi:TatD DNase family protein
MQFIDTHCHIHSRDYPLDADEAMKRAVTHGVKKLICVGTDEDDSERAVAFANTRENCWASIGMHPHDATRGVIGIEKLHGILKADRSKIVAIGECGLDYFYDNSPRQLQAEMLHAQIQLALEHDLPMIFHVREAFDDFWPIFDRYSGIRGVLHSFTDTQRNMEIAIEKDLYIGVNGISTFTKSMEQQEMFGAIPLEKMILETDSPFLTPVPKRGTVNEPAFVTLVATKQADLRHISLEELSVATSLNATTLFSL